MKKRVGFTVRRYCNVITSDMSDECDNVEIFLPHQQKKNQVTQSRGADSDGAVKITNSGTATTAASEAPPTLTKPIKFTFSADNSWEYFLLLFLFFLFLFGA